MQQEPNKLKELYSLYEENGLLGGAEYELFESADDEQKKQLFDLAASNNILGDVDYDTFSSAWGEKKKTQAIPDTIAQPSDSSDLPLPSVSPSLQEIETEYLRFSPDLYDVQKKLSKYDSLKDESGSVILETQEQLDDYNSLVDQFNSISGQQREVAKKYESVLKDNISALNNKAEEKPEVTPTYAGRKILEVAGGLTRGISGTLRGVNNAGAYIDRITGVSNEDIKEHKQLLDGLADSLDMFAATEFDTRKYGKDEETSRMIAEGFGSMLTFMLGGGSVKAGAALGAAMNAGFATEEAANMIDDAKLLTNSEFSSKYNIPLEEINKVKTELANKSYEDIEGELLLKSGAIGLGEGVIGIIGKLAPVAKVVGKINARTGGKLAKYLRGIDGNIAGRTVSGALAEGLQEGTAELLNNVVAKDLYDTTRDIYDGIPESVLVGGILGGGLGAFRVKAQDILQDPNSTEVEQEAASKTLKYINTKEKLASLQNQGGNAYVNKEYAELQSAKKELQESLESSESEVAQQAIMDEISEIEKKSNDILLDANQSYQKMSDEDKNRVDEIDTDLGSFQRAIDREQTTRGKEIFEEKIKNLLTEKEQIENKYQDQPVQQTEEFSETEQEVESEQKPIVSPETSRNYANLTEDSEGNFVFFHKGQKGYDEIKPASGTNKVTGREEAAAIGKVGGVAMYYTQESDQESGVTGDATYAVKVPKEEVYDFNADPNNYIEEAKRRHDKEHPNKAFDVNTQLAYVTKIAGENGFKMVVSEWKGTSRAQTTEALKPSDVKLRDGSTVTQDFSESFETNREMGYTPEARKNIEGEKAKLFEEIQKLAGDNYSSTEYKMGKLANYKVGDKFVPEFPTEESVDKAIAESTVIPQELKDRYEGLKTAEELPARSVRSKEFISKNGVRSKAFKMESAPEGTYLDIELVAGKDGRKLSQEEVIEALPEPPIVVENDGNNLRLRIPNKLSDSQMMDLMKATEQEAIAQVHNKKGVLHAQNEKLLNDYGGAFNPDFFKLPQQPINQEDAIQERETTEVPSESETQPIQEVEGEVRGERENQEGTQEGRGQDEGPKATQEKQKPIDKKKKKSINKLRSKVLNSLNRGKLNDIREEVADLIGLRLHAIDNEQLLSEVETTLKDLSARVPKADGDILDLTDRAKAAIKEVESKLSPNDLSVKGIEKQISKSIPDRISKLEDKDFSIDNLVGARSSFTRILNDIRKLEEAVNILDDFDELENAEQSLSKLQSLREQLADVASKHQEAIEKAQKELNASNKKRASSFRPSSITSDKLLQDEIDSFLEQVDNLDSDQIELTVDINTILDDLDVGFIPIANMSAIKNEVRANSQIKSNNFRKAVDNINGMPKKAKNFVLRLFQRFTDPRRKAERSLKKWEDEIRASEFSQWEYLAGTAQNPAFVNINNDYITATEQYRESGAVEMEKLHRAANLRLGEKVKSAVDFSEGLMRNQDRFVKVGMLMFERFWQNKYGVSYIDKMMKDANLLEKISDDSTRNSYEKMFKSLPKKKDGSIDYQKAISNLSGVEKRLFDVANKMFDPRGEMARKQMIAASKRGMLFTPAKNYFPVLRKLGAETKDVSLDELNDILIPKISSDRAKEQKSQDISLVDLNLFNVMSSYIHEVNRDFYLTDPVRTGNKFYNKAIKESDGTARTAMEGFKRGFTNNIIYTFSPKATSKLQKWTNKLLAATYIDYLVKAGRSFVSEPISEGLRTVLASDYNHRLYKDAANSLDSSVKDMIAKIKGLEYKDGRISTTGEFRSNFKKLLSITNAPFNKDFSRQFSDGSIRITSFENKDSGVDKAASYVLGTPNRATLFRAWMPAFNNKFKEVTGADIDYNKLDDNEYVRKNRKAIKEAGAYANYKTSLLKGFSSAAGGRTMNKVPFFGNIDANKSPIAFKLNQFLSSFGFRDAFLLKEGVRDMALATSEKILGKGLGIDAFKDVTAQASGTGARGFRIVGGLTLAGIIYPILQDMISYLSMDDEEDKLKNWEKELKEKIESGNYFSPKEMAKQVISYYVFTSTSKYGYASRIFTLFSLGVIEDMLNGQAKRAKSAKEKKAIKDDIQSIKGLSRAFFFTEPINLNLMGNSYMDKTSLQEGLAMVPAAGIALDYAGEMAQSLELLNSTEDDEQQKALGLVTYDALKLMMLRKGTAFPFIGDLDKEAYKVKREIKKPQSKDKGGRTVNRRTTGGRTSSGRTTSDRR